MPRKRGRQAKGLAETDGPPTILPHAYIQATSPPATPAPKRVKQLKGYPSQLGTWNVMEADIPIWMVEHKLTVDELHREWEKVIEKDYARIKEAHQRVAALQGELDMIEEKWAAKLEDAVEEIGLL